MILTEVVISFSVAQNENNWVVVPAFGTIQKLASMLTTKTNTLAKIQSTIRFLKNKR
jgi:hypothetical protein